MHALVLILNDFSVQTRPQVDMSKSPMLDSSDSIFWFWQARYLAETHASLPFLQRQALSTYRYPFRSFLFFLVFLFCCFASYAPLRRLPVQIWDRIMGIVILPSVLTTSDYKTNIWSEDPIWKKIHSLKTYEDKIPEIKEWLKGCHGTDEEVAYSAPISKDDEEPVRYSTVEFPASGVQRKKGEKHVRAPSLSLFSLFLALSLTNPMPNRPA